jgi:hypothetical protein
MSMPADPFEAGGGIERIIDQVAQTETDVVWLGNGL